MATMKDLGKLQTRHMGNQVLAADANHISGYFVKSYTNYTPDELEHVRTIQNNGEMTWDEAYDEIFGKPTAPDFTKVFNA